MLLFDFCGRVGVGVCVEKLRLKLTSAKVEVEAELGKKNSSWHFQISLAIQKNKCGMINCAQKPECGIFQPSSRTDFGTVLFKLTASISSKSSMIFLVARPTRNR